MEKQAITLGIMKSLVAVRHSVGFGSSYQTCGSYAGRCVNLRKCVQRNGSFYSGKCHMDLQPVEVKRG